MMMVWSAAERKTWAQISIGERASNETEGRKAYSERNGRKDIPQALPRFEDIFGLLVLRQGSLLARLNILAADVGDSPRGRAVALGTQQRGGLGGIPFWRHGGWTLRNGSLH